MPTKECQIRPILNTTNIKSVSTHWTLDICHLTFDIPGFRRAGFTLVELLIVIVIIAILTAIGLVVFREVNTRARDGSRIADLDSLRSAIQIATHDEKDMAAALCFGTTAPCSEPTFPIKSTTRKTDGTGWIKINFDSENTVNFNILPLDPLNNDKYFFTYKSDGQYWKVEATLESVEYKKLMEEDGGNKDDRYEVGSNVKTL